MVSIGELNYKIVADTKSFEKGAVATRKELAQAKRAMRDTETATERYGREVDELGTLLKKGAIDQKTYNRAVQQSKTRLDASAKSTKVATTNNKAFTASLKGVAGALIGLQAGRMVLGGITSELQRIDEVAKTSRKLGIMTDELIALRNAAAELSGTSDQVVDKSLQRFTVAISEAATGTGEAKEAINDLKLSAAQLNAVGPFKAFQLVGEAMKGVENQTDRLRISYELFGRGGADLVNTLNAGEGALLAYQKAAHDTGQTFTDEMAKGVEDANDAVGRLQLSMQTFAKDAAITFAEPIEQLAELFSDLTVDFKNFRKELSSPFGTSPFGALSKLTDFLNSRTRTLGDTPSTRDPNFGRANKPPVPTEADLQLEANARVTTERIKREEDDAKKRREDGHKELLAQQKAAHNHARQLAVDLQKRRVETARDELAAFEKTVNKSAVSFDRMGGTRGSSGEFQALAQIRKGDQERREQAKRDKEADRKRQVFIDRLDQAVQLLDDIKKKPSATGVG